MQLVIDPVIETPRTAKDKRGVRRQILARAHALGWSQNELARKAGYKSPGFVSRVLNDEVNSPGVWPRLFRTLRKFERRRQRSHAA